MEVELHPAISLLGTFNVLIAQVEVLTRAQSSHLDQQRYKILNICAPISRQLGRNITELEIRRASTIFQAHYHPGGEPPQL